MGSPNRNAHSINAQEALQLLADPIARDILQALSGMALSAAEVAEWSDCSRTTVYRRLDRLEEAGLVTTELTVDPDGHHHRTYHKRIDALTLSVCPEGFDAEIHHAVEPTSSE